MDMRDKHHREKGIVLVASLISLLVVSLVVTAVVSTSGTEVKMSINAQMTNQTFQAAESAITQIITNDAEMLTAIDGGVGGLSNTVSVAMNTVRLNSESVMEYMGTGIPPGYSIGQAESYMFEAEGRGYIDDNNTYNDSDDEASTRVLQGVYRIVLASDDDGGE